MTADEAATLRSIPGEPRTVALAKRRLATSRHRRWLAQHSRLPGMLRPSGWFRGIRAEQRHEAIEAGAQMTAGDLITAMLREAVPTPVPHYHCPRCNAPVYHDGINMDRIRAGSECKGELTTRLGCDACVRATWHGR